MQNVRAQDGFTMYELMIVLAIMAVLTALAVPAVWRYRTMEEARSNAVVVAGAIRVARTRALREGIQHFVLFNAPASAPGAVARVVRDVDNDFIETGGLDNARDVFFNPGTSASITPYGQGMGSPYPTAPLAPSDQGGPDLSTITAGASFPLDPTTVVPAVGFNAQGVAVALGSPAAWGSGSGAYYVTDNARNVFAVDVGPLGEVHVRALDGATNTWN